MPSEGTRPFSLYRQQTVDLPPIQRCAAGGDFTLEVSVHNGRLRRRGDAVPTARGKRGRDTKVSLPLLTPQPFLRTRLPSVARLNARGPQGRLLLQGHTLDGSGAFRSDGVRALHRLAAHCHARQITQANLRAVKRPKIRPTHGTEPPFLPFRRATAGSRGAKEDEGSQEGDKKPFGVLSPFCSRR